MEIGEVQSNNQMKQIHTCQSMVDSNPWQESLPLVLNAPPKPSSTTHHPLLFHGLIVHQTALSEILLALLHPGDALSRQVTLDVKFNVFTSDELFIERTF